jgi:hypothetical protein
MGWAVRGSNPGEGEIFRTCPDPSWGPPSLLYNGYRVFPWGKEWPVRDADPSPLSSAVGHERVELYLYSPYGPYGLYRASLPVQGALYIFTKVHGGGHYSCVPYLVLLVAGFPPFIPRMSCVRCGGQVLVSSTSVIILLVLC